MTDTQGEEDEVQVRKRLRWGEGVGGGGGRRGGGSLYSAFLGECVGEWVNSCCSCECDKRLPHIFRVDCFEVQNDLDHQFPTHYDLGPRRQKKREKKI